MNETSTLLLADDLIPQVFMGVKTNTIRKGHRDIALGALLIEPVDGTVPSFTVTVTEVKHCLMHELTDVDLRREGLRGRVDLPAFLEGMKRFYPDVTMETPVTVINFIYRD